jgi:hypothetical protein
MRLSVRPQSTFADLELQRQGLAVDATLHAIGAFLDAQPGLVDLVREDLVRDLRQPHTGRDGLTAEQTLRAYVLKHVKDWDLRELRERTADGFTLRDFTRFFSAPVPTHKAFHRAFCRLRPETVRALNEAVVRGRGAGPRGWPTAPLRYPGHGDEHPLPDRLGLVVGWGARAHAPRRQDPGLAARAGGPLRQSYAPGAPADAGDRTADAHAA